jgi:peptidoglycan/LPS O-acetylase OafA/YrhL
MGRFIAGDPLRALAAVSVLLFHVSLFALLANHDRDFAAAYGHVAGDALGNLDLGLYVFFVLSGYLLGRPFAAALVDARPLPAIRPYLRNRLLRIVPAFWVVAAVTFAWYGSDGASLHQIAAVFGFVQVYDQSTFANSHIGHAWTLDAEMGFYLILPFAAATALRALSSAPDPRGRAVRVGTAVLAVATASLVVREVVPPTFGWLSSLPAMLFAFVPGALLALLEPLATRPGGWRPPRQTGLLLGVGAVVAFAIVVQVSRSHVLARGLLAAAFSGMVVAAPLVRQWSTGTCSRILDNTLMRWLGQRSYGIYLVHASIASEILVALPRMSNTWLFFAVATVATLLVTVLASDLLHRWVELPALRRRAAWQRRPQPARV